MLHSLLKDISQAVSIKLASMYKEAVGDADLIPRAIMNAYRSIATKRIGGNTLQQYDKLRRLGNVATRDMSGALTHESQVAKNMADKIEPGFRDAFNSKANQIERIRGMLKDRLNKTHAMKLDALQNKNAPMFDTLKEKELGLAHNVEGMRPLLSNSKWLADSENMSFDNVKNVMEDFAAPFKRRGTNFGKPVSR